MLELKRIKTDYLGCSIGGFDLAEYQHIHFRGHFNPCASYCFLYFHDHALWHLLSYCLGAPDPLFVFPALVGVTSFLQQKTNHVAVTESNAGMSKVFKWMPVLSIVFMLGLPSGLVIYYAASGFLQIAGDFVLRKFV